MDPVLVAILFADQVIAEVGTNKKSLIGTFNRFFHPGSFPHTFPPWSIYIAAENVPPGEHDISLNLVSDDGTDQVALAISGNLKVEEGSKGAELQFRITNAAFPKAGTYSLVFKIAGHQVGARTLTVEQVPEGGKG